MIETPLSSDLLSILPNNADCRLHGERAACEFEVDRIPVISPSSRPQARSRARRSVDPVIDSGTEVIPLATNRPRSPSAGYGANRAADGGFRETGGLRRARAKRALPEAARPPRSAAGDASWSRPHGEGPR